MCDLPTDFKMMVLDVLRYDIEPVSSILTMLNAHGCVGWGDILPRKVTIDDLVPVLQKLWREDFVRFFNDRDGQLEEVQPADVDADVVKSGFFLMTDKARSAWKEWEPPTDSRRSDNRPGKTGEP
jgi:hypothetical protein